MSRASALAAARRPSAIVGVATALYLVFVLGSRWWHGWTVLGGAALVLAVLLLGWRPLAFPAGPTSSAGPIQPIMPNGEPAGPEMPALTRRGSLPLWLLAAMGEPLHLVILATGSADSRILPLLAAWVAVVGRAPHRRLAAVGAALVLPLAAQAWIGRVTLGAALEIALLVGMGWIVASALGLASAEGSTAYATSPGAAPSPAPPPPRPAPPPPAEPTAGSSKPTPAAASPTAASPSEPATPTPETTLTTGGSVQPMLDRARAAAGARRAVLWQVDAVESRARPSAVSGGAAPVPIGLAGDPLRWTWEEAMAQRLERAPSWADGSVCLLPLGRRSDAAGVLSFEFDGEAPATAALEPWALLVASTLALGAGQGAAATERQRYHRLIESLAGLPTRLADQPFAAALANAARELVDATGAVVALWTEDAGRVLAVVGDDGGPPLDAELHPAASHLAFAAQNATSLFRSEAELRRSRLPVIAKGERWFGRPRVLLAVPLLVEDGGAAGVIGVWDSGKPTLDEAAPEALAAVAPFAAILLQRSLAFEDARSRADLDPLTGLHNRASFARRFNRESARYRRYRRPLSLLLIDLDHFKALNDEFGHEAGDVALKAVAGVIRAGLRQADLAVRFGGEEFLALLTETRLDRARDVAERLRRNVEALDVVWKGRPLRLTVSIGVSACGDCIEDPAELVSSADAALYAAKRDGRNRVEVAAMTG